MLELPDEDQLSRDHDFDKPGKDHLRYMYYKPRSPEENTKAGDLYLCRHTDVSSITLFFRQLIAALQVQDKDEEWKWIKPQDTATVMANAGDSLVALTGGYVKAAVHRANAPPEDQVYIDRIGVLYVSRYASVLLWLLVHS